MAAGGVAMAQQKSTPGARWEPARHEKDDWFDQLPGKHRLVFDTIAYDGLAEAILFANNFMRVNRADYGLQNSDLAVVIVVRHRSTPFGYNDRCGRNTERRSRREPKLKIQKANWRRRSTFSIPGTTATCYPVAKRHWIRFLSKACS